MKWKFTLSGRATCCCRLIFGLLPSASVFFGFSVKMSGLFLGFSVKMSGVFFGFLAKSNRGAASGLIGINRRPRRIFKEPRKLLRGVMSRPIQVGCLDIVKPISLISIWTLTVCGYYAL